MRDVQLLQAQVSLGFPYESDGRISLEARGRTLPKPDFPHVIVLEVIGIVRNQWTSTSIQCRWSFRLVRGGMTRFGVSTAVLVLRIAAGEVICFVTF